MKIKRLLIANRGEISCRIQQTCMEMGITPVVLFTKEDAAARHVRMCDESFDVSGYLNQDEIIAISKKNKIDAIHPGYGFLSENSSFAKKVLDNKLIWIGPTWKAMTQLGDKISSKKIAEKLKVPTLKSHVIPRPKAVGDLLVIKKNAKELGYPVLIKASAGGGGRGMRIVQNETELEMKRDQALREAESAFGNPELFMEKYIPKARHVEVQIVGDSHGKIIHLGGRDCSIQRRHQKLIEESYFSENQKIFQAAVKLAKSVDYTSLGTVEFLLADDEFYFLEMNTRLQVEHPVTEMISGLDLVRLQIEIAQGEKINYESLREISGHSIEARIVAEDPENNFIPSSGKLNSLKLPRGAGIRVDSGYDLNDTISDKFDSLIAKIIVHAPDRAQATERLIFALKNTIISGIKTNCDFMTAILKSPEWKFDEIFTKFIEQFKYESTFPKINSREIRDPWLSTDEVIVKSNSTYSQSHAIQENPFIATLSGKVSKIYQKENIEIEKGALILTMEAMKMEFPVYAPTTGKVEKYFVAVNASVKPGMELLKWQAKK